MSSSITRIVVVAVVLSGCANVFAQPSRNEVYEQLPDANKRILKQLDGTGISKDWNHPISRDSKQTFQSAFADTSDKRAWEVLEARFILGNDSSDDWRQHWRWISYQQSTFPTSRLTLGG